MKGKGKDELASRRASSLQVRPNLHRHEVSGRRDRQKRNLRPLQRRPMVKSDRPAWLSDARVFYSRIEEGSKDPVSVFIPPDGEVSAGNPGRLRLRLRPVGRSLQVLDHQECAEGVIRSEGLVHGIRYVMRRDENPVWTLSTRSVVRKRPPTTYRRRDVDVRYPVLLVAAFDRQPHGRAKAYRPCRSIEANLALASNQAAKPTMSLPP